VWHVALGADVEASDADGATPLHLAAMARQRWRRRVLHEPAALRKRLKAVEVAEPEAGDADGPTLLHLAAHEVERCACWWSW